MLNAAREYPSRYDYFPPELPGASAPSFAPRPRGICRGCGFGRAEQAHHPDLSYAPAATITADRITVFCRLCHRVMTLLRRFPERRRRPGTAPRAPQGSPRDGR